MRRWITLGAAAVAVAVGVGAVNAQAAPTGQQKQPVNQQPRDFAVAPVDATKESKFTPITPCRIADTRLGGGIIAANATRTFRVTGSTGFAAQGGTSTGCGIPDAATSVALAITVTAQTSDGYVTAYPNGATKPNVSQVSFARAVNISGNTDATLGVSGQINAFLGSRGAAHLVLDLTGYYISPMQATVSSTGALVGGSRVTSVSRLNTGAYQVEFDRDVSGCAYAATSSFFSIVVQAAPRLSNTHAVYVGSAGVDGLAIDTSFTLTVSC